MTKKYKIPRSLLKTLSYGVMHIIVAFIVAMCLTGDWRIAISISLIEPVVQTFAFYAHEKAWDKKPTVTEG